MSQFDQHAQSAQFEQVPKKAEDVPLDEQIASEAQHRLQVATDAAKYHEAKLREACRAITATQATLRDLNSPAGANYAEKLLRQEIDPDGTPLIEVPAEQTVAGPLYGDEYEDD